MSITTETVFIEAAIANFEERLSAAVEDAANPEAMPGVGTLSLLHRDLAALYVMRRDAEQKTELDKRLAAIIDAE